MLGRVIHVAQRCNWSVWIVFVVQGATQTVQRLAGIMQTVWQQIRGHHVHRQLSTMAHTRWMRWTQIGHRHFWHIMLRAADIAHAKVQRFVFVILIFNLLFFKMSTVEEEKHDQGATNRNAVPQSDLAMCMRIIGYQ